LSITFPLALPSSPPGFRTFDMLGRSVVGMARSPFTGSQQLYEFPGEWWELQASLPPMTRANAERWIAFLLSLRGRSGTFLAGDPLGKTPQGVATGTPLVNGANQTGKSLTLKGFTISITGILKAGDYIQIGTGLTQRLYKCLKDVNSDGGGNAVLDIWPRLRESPADNAAVTTASTAGLFRLGTNDSAHWTVDVAQKYGLGLTAVEAF
jgi:hypothetical protein